MLRRATPRLASWVTPLTANELHCLELRGMRGGSLSFGNSVRSLGILRGLVSFVSAGAGGKNSQIQSLIKNGRQAAYDRMMTEAENNKHDGVIGVSTNIGPIGGMVEFNSYGSGIDVSNKNAAEKKPTFSATCSGEQYYCLTEAGFEPKKVVFGNAAYSSGITGMLSGTIRTALFSGEVSSYSKIFNDARSKALADLRKDAFNKGCNFVSGVRMQSVRLPFVQEVTFYGSGCHHPSLGTPATADDVLTSALHEEELWSLITIGRRPLQVLTGCSVHNLGIGKAITGTLQQAKGGETSRYTQLTSNAREAVMKQIQKQADAVKADEVISVRISIEEIRPGLVEFFAYGTAIRHDSKLQNESVTLPTVVALGKRKDFHRRENLSRPRALGRTSATGHAELSEKQSHLLSTSGSYLKTILLSSKRVIQTVLGIVIRFLSKLFPFLNNFASKKMN
eukprot:TRINITY_DN34636_c0_g1_i1.p1 TRINITY_DN34636_c0_g1~~TRINITY_DN34636_c0_g1_i1.p1  ORF type:complete len:451 (+),score=89.15 TRINITY_DN34636_c0_g1_i1:45-1397(+)